VELSDEEVKKTVSLIEANETPEIPVEPERRRRSSNKDILESLNGVTNIKSVASSMAISKVQARRRSRRRSSSTRSDGEAGQSLLSSQDDMDDPTMVIGDSVHPPTDAPQTQQAVPAVQRNDMVVTASISDIRAGRYCTKSLNVGKDNMTVRDWLSLPQFYIVSQISFALESFRKFLTHS